MKPVYDVIVVGAGAAGMAAAISAGEKGARVAVLEKGEKAGRKVLASGNGRCNLMNHGMLRYYGDVSFAHRVMEICTADDLAAFFRKYGLMISEEEDGRSYPFSRQSATVTGVLMDAMKINGAELFLNSAVSGVRRERDGFTVGLSSGENFRTGRVIISCGGEAQSRLGGSTDGYAFLKSLGHSVTNVFPSLVPLITEPKAVSGLSGIRVRCRVTLFNDGAPVHREHGEVLFTEYGISGICVMQCSRFILPPGSVIELNLAGDVFAGTADLAAELQKRRGLFGAFPPVVLLEGFLAPRVSYAVLKQAGIPLRGETVSELSDAQLERIAESAFHYRIPVLGTKGMEFAQVTAGGACCGEFSCKTMESLIIPGLYAAGEVLDVDGDCGGFNLMFAFASGRIAGLSAGCGPSRSEGRELP